MVMMGQQLMDSERKQEDDEIDDYVIKPLNNHSNRTGNSTEEQPPKQQRNSTQENMNRGEVPTLAALAQFTHEKHQGTNSNNTGAENVISSGDTGGGDNNNKMTKQVLGMRREESSIKSNGEDLTPKMNGKIGSHHLEDHEQHRDERNGNNCHPSTVSVGGGEATTTSSGRTSSCDSSGVGTSLTSSSSSEPIDRGEIAVSPNPENLGGSGSSVPSVAINGNVAGNVPEDSKSSISNYTGNVNGVDTVVSVPIPNGVATSSDSCQALLLCRDYNEQMTAAKKFLKMVRDGINENGKTVAGAAASSRLKGGDSSTDEDAATTISNSTTPNSKSTILSTNCTPINNNNNIVNSSSSGSATKEKVGGGVVSVGRQVFGSNKIPINVPILAAVLGQHGVLGKDEAPSCVQEVWAHNLLEEFSKIRKVVKKYTFIAMDTEFPGIVVRPACTVRSAGVFPYELLKVNVDRLKIIQLGVTFMDKHGKIPPGVCTWQFNFKFSLNKDLYASDSISLLTRCGIQFEKHAEMGIEPEMFGEYFMSSGMVTSDQVTYLTFHSGFDFGYLIKLLSNLPLPDNEERFFEIMKIYFPNVYDLKFLMKSVDLHGGLQDIANQMGQERVGTQHQAGSDSLLTGMTFFKLLSTDVFNGEIDEAKYCGKLYGFHMNEDGTKDEGWSEITGDNLLDAASPKPPLPTSRTTASNNNGSTSNNLLLHPSSTHQSSHSTTGNSSDNR